MTSSDRFTLWLGLVCVACWQLPQDAAAQSSTTKTKSPGNSTGSAATVVATVDDEPLTQGDLDRMFRIHQVSDQRRALERDSMTEKLIDRILIRRHLAKNQIAAPKTEVDGGLQALLRNDGADGKQAEEILKKNGYSARVIREELEFRLAWRIFVERRENGNGIREYFKTNHERFDGTEVHARQIVLRVRGDDATEPEKAEGRLSELKRKIEAGELTFEAAAREHSEAPSGEQGGDVGWFPYQGKMPPDVTRVAFVLQVNEISPPFRTAYGVHLLQVLERKPGELSLEDVRDEVVTAFGDALWRTTADELRKKAKIELKSARPKRPVGR